jgi:hypothetical protein
MGAIGETVVDIVAAPALGGGHPLPAPVDRVPRAWRPPFGARRMGLRRLCKLVRLDSLKTRV